MEPPSVRIMGTGVTYPPSPHETGYGSTVMLLLSERAAGPGMSPAVLMVVLTPPTQKGVARFTACGEPLRPPGDGVPPMTTFRARTTPSAPTRVGDVDCPGQNVPLAAAARLVLPLLSPREITRGPAH